MTVLFLRTLTFLDVSSWKRALISGKCRAIFYNLTRKDAQINKPQSQSKFKQKNLETVKVEWVWNDLDVAFSAGISLALAFIALARLNETSGFFRSEGCVLFCERRLLLGALHRVKCDPHRLPGVGRWNKLSYFTCSSATCSVFCSIVLQWLEEYWGKTGIFQLFKCETNLNNNPTFVFAIES